MNGRPIKKHRANKGRGILDFIPKLGEFVVNKAQDLYRTMSNGRKKGDWSFLYDPEAYTKGAQWVENEVVAPLKSLKDQADANYDKASDEYDKYAPQAKDLYDKYAPQAKDLYDKHVGWGLKRGKGGYMTNSDPEYPFKYPEVDTPGSLSNRLKSFTTADLERIPSELDNVSPEELKLALYYLHKKYEEYSNREEDDQERAESNGNKYTPDPRIVRSSDILNCITFIKHFMKQSMSSAVEAAKKRSTVKRSSEDSWRKDLDEDDD